jgi:hypothetical protein
VIFDGGQFTFWENCVPCLRSGLEHDDCRKSDNLKYCA